MKLIRTAVLALALLTSVSGAGAQDKTSHAYNVTVGHIVKITWTASATLGVTYNIYVSGTSGGPYTRIGNTSLLQFIDVGTTAGNKYFYVVTAVDSNGESANSNEVSVIIPTP